MFDKEKIAKISIILTNLEKDAYQIRITIAPSELACISLIEILLLLGWKKVVWYSKEIGKSMIVRSSNLRIFCISIWG